MLTGALIVIAALVVTGLVCFATALLIDHGRP